MYSVYKHTNKENKKVYIGITSRQVEQRWANGHGYKNNLIAGITLEIAHTNLL